jgi:murein DD-endopeptidase MepM/ murein hydrolase activator NlpD
MLTEKNRILAYLQSRSKALNSTPNRRHALISMAAAIGACFGVVAAFGNVSGGIENSIPQQSIVESLSLSQATPAEEGGELFIREEKVRPGDSASALLGRLGVENSRLIDAARTQPQAQPLFRQLSPGKTITAYLDRNGQLRSLIFPLNDKQDQALELDNTNEGLRVSQKALALETRIAVKSADINYSLFGATDEAGIPDSVASQLIDIFGGDIDFHRDLRKGDHFSVAYETVMHQGKALRSGRILAAEFVNDGQSYKAVWFKGTDGQGGYYTPDGKSLRKAFLRSPLEFSRVTSGFSTARFHPILQKWRAHKGVDYGAPIGTHVKSTADAIVDYVGLQNGYGKVVVLKHQGPYTTLYGHLSGFAPSIHKGSRIAQGDIIGYVGQTGLASGPHLHYEFRIDGVFKDPLSVALPGSPPLTSAQLAQFRNESAVWLARIDVARNLNLASSD